MPRSRSTQWSTAHQSPDRTACALTFISCPFPDMARPFRTGCGSPWRSTREFPSAGQRLFVVIRKASVLPVDTPCGAVVHPRAGVVTAAGVQSGVVAGPGLVVFGLLEVVTVH